MMDSLLTGETSLTAAKEFREEFRRNLLDCQEDQDQSDPDKPPTVRT